MNLPKDYPIESLALYSFSWQFDGSCGYFLSGDCLYKVCENGIEREYFGEDEGNLAYDLGLHEDHSEFVEMAKDDPLLNCVARKYPGLRPRRVGLKEAIVIAVAQQNASFKQAWGNVWRLYKLIGKEINAFGRKYLVLGEVSEEALRKAGFGYRSETIVRALSMKVDCANVDELGRVKGIGNYSLSLIKLFHCRDYSAFPLDRWLMALSEKVYGDPRGLERFGKWRGLASLLVTVALDAVPLRKAIKRVEEGRVCPEEEFSPLTMWRFW